MSSRIFQSVVLQMKDSTERAIGVIDSEGTVVACNELSCIGEHWPGAVEAVNRGEGDAVRFDGRTFKALAGWGAQFDYAAFVKGEDSEAQMLCAMATVALNGAKTYYEEKHDKATFVKNIISDNILLGDIYVRAKELHFVSEAPRAVFLIRQVETSDPALIDVVHTLFPDKQVDFVLSISETDVALIKQLSEGAEPRELYKIAKQIEEKITEELHVRVVIARALVNNPQMIIADEPTGNLDPMRSLEIMMLLERINELGTTVLVVTHAKELVNRFSKRVVAIENGRIISDETGGYYNNETTI